MSDSDQGAALAGPGPAAVLRPAADLLQERIGEDLVVLDVDGQQVHQFNGVGAFAWQCMDGQLSLRDIAKRIAEVYEVTEEAALRDLEAFSAELLRAGALIRL